MLSKQVDLMRWPLIWWCCLFIPLQQQQHPFHHQTTNKLKKEKTISSSSSFNGDEQVEQQEQHQTPVSTLKTTLELPPLPSPQQPSTTSIAALFIINVIIKEQPELCPTSQQQQILQTYFHKEKHIKFLKENLKIFYKMIETLNDDVTNNNDSIQHVDFRFNHNNNNPNNNAVQEIRSDNNNKIARCLFTSDQLIYLGEGNSSLVVGIKSTCKVIRILKSDAKKLRNCNDVLSHLLQHIDYNETVLPFVLPQHLFTPPTLIYLSNNQLDLIKNLVKDKRPSFRLDKTLPNCGYALMMSDCCTIPNDNIHISYDCAKHSVIAIEIKPKQGFIPDENLFCTNDFLRLKSVICRFGLSQFYKLQKQSIKQQSAYCPLDLFSGCPSQMLYAIFCLIQNPQNNFRVFLNSNLVYGADCSNIDDLRKILARFFVQQNNNKSSTNYVDPVSSLSLLLLQILLKPLCCDHHSMFNDLATNNNINGDYDDNLKFVPQVERQMEHLNDNKKYVFVRTFIQMFDKIINDNNNMNFTFDKTNNKKNDFNNNVLLQTTTQTANTSQTNHQQQQQSSLNMLIMDSQLNANILNDNFLKQELFSGNGEDDDGTGKHCRTMKTMLINAFMNAHRLNNGDNNNIRCLLHQDKPFNNTQRSKNNMNCVCKDASKHNLPNGSILQSILQMQKLDTIDSYLAVDLFNKLFLKYKHFINEQHDQQQLRLREHLESFILDNADQLNTLWRFLLSLTAKDCSIMIAMQPFNHDGNNESDISGEHSSTSTSQTARPLIEVTDKTSGKSYMCNVSIIDLDNKPACKIQQSLHNDRRMIFAFLKALKLAAAANNNNQQHVNNNHNNHPDEQCNKSSSFKIPGQLLNMFNTVINTNYNTNNNNNDDCE